MRWEKEWRTNSLRSTCVAPESARMGEGVIEHNMGGWEIRVFVVRIVRFQSGEGLRWEKREIGLGETMVGKRGKVV
jgi:hypothetical protein